MKFGAKAQLAVAAVCFGPIIGLILGFATQLQAKAPNQNALGGGWRNSRTGSEGTRGDPRGALA